MSDYRIEKVRYPVELTLASGDRLQGDMFLQAFARFRAGPEEPLDVLNGPEKFLPLELSSGELLLVQKHEIAVVATALPETDYAAETGIIGMHVDISFVFGETKRGSVFPELPSDRPRLVDFLNNTPLHFLPFFTADQLLLVSVAHIAYARPAS